MPGPRETAGIDSLALEKRRQVHSQSVQTCRTTHDLARVANDRSDAPAAYGTTEDVENAPLRV